MPRRCRSRPCGARGRRRHARGGRSEKPLRVRRRLAEGCLAVHPRYNTLALAVAPLRGPGGLHLTARARGGARQPPARHERCGCTPGVGEGQHARRGRAVTHRQNMPLPRGRQKIARPKTCEKRAWRGEWGGGACVHSAPCAGNSSSQLPGRRRELEKREPPFLLDPVAIFHVPYSHG